MPEMRFRIEWPDGQEDLCYSPSLIIKDYFQPGHTYALSDFLRRSREALQIASDRVAAQYGFPCSLAIGQLQRIETTARRYANDPSAQVRVLGFTP
jgi:uncharacterized repeat protein (TIGR04042 family)